MTYDANSRLTSADQTMHGHATSVTVAYDPIGSVVAFTQTVDGFSWTTSYDDDYAAGRVTMTSPSGTQVVQHVDALTRLAQVQQDGLQVAGFVYDHLGGTVTQSSGNGLTTLTATDALWRVTRLSSAVAEYRYGYDNLGNRTFLQRAHQSGAPTDVYVYDGLNQLTDVWYGADATEPAAITDAERVRSYTLDLSSAIWEAPCIVR